MSKWSYPSGFAKRKKTVHQNEVNEKLPKLTPQFTTATGATSAEDDWKPVAVEKLRCLSGVITVATGGRTGNQIMEYASAWSLAQQYGLQLAVPTEMVSTLHTVFQNLSATPLEDLLQRPSCKAHRLRDTEVLRYATNDSLLYPVSRYVQWALRHSQPIILRKWIVVTESIAYMSGKLHKEFRYRREYADMAERTLTRVRRAAAQKAGSHYSKVLTVSIHVRRSDYASYLIHRFNAKNMAEVGYYRRAAKRMRKLLQPEPAALAFIVASDDSEWCQNTLLPALNRDFQEGSPPSSVFLTSDNSSSSPVHDLAVLSAADHSVLSYGTFGTWAALMAGGRAIVFDLAAANPHLPPGTRNSAMSFAPHLPSWELLT
ncbi:galactoside alpha-(1,2)-fucosyltransferase 2-like [Schistocerca americana]|uniref:galactoside alpha-(1,2)-fucosyltransferase 2-like n=1 Tax=Schistocerca americana TaxID=7009 RepID=UPI001F4F6EAA|nr:galactoside alpha-(1,2)-fucosyltransferase 2-like [Schistocerca americana]